MNEKNKTKICVIAFISLLLTVLTESIGYCQVQKQFYPEKDAFLAQSAPVNNFGTGEMIIGKHITGEMYVPVLYFDISSIPSNATVTSAKLTLTRGTSVPSDNVTGSAYRITNGNWNESTVTWNSAITNSGITYDDTFWGTINAGSTVVSIDITLSTIVQKWVIDKPSNYGIILFPSSSSPNGNDWWVKSKESSAGKPVLTVYYCTPSTAPTGISASSNPVCPGSSVTLTRIGGSLGEGATWEWYSGSCGGTHVGSGSSITVNPSSTTTYYVRAENYCNETACASVTINIQTLSTAPTGASATPSVINQGASVTLTRSGGSLGSGAYWKWYSGSCGGISIGTGSSIIINPDATTTYFVRAEGNCNTTACVSAAVTVTSGSSIGSVTGKTPLCIGESATYTANNVILSGGTGAWSSSNTSIAIVSSTGVVTGMSAGVCNIIYTITGGTGGTVSKQQTVTVNPNAGITSLSGKTQICTGDTATFTAVSVITSGGTGAWSSSNNSIATINSSGTVTGVSAGQADITYTITGGCGGTTSKSQIITVSSGKAITSVTGLSSICEDISVPFSANGVIAGGGQGVWSSSDVAIASVVQTGSVTGVSAGTCNIIYTISGGCGETVSAQQSVTIKPKPLGGTGAVSICSDVTLSYNLQTNVNTLGNSQPSAFTWAASANTAITGATTSVVNSGVITDRPRNISGSDQKVVYTITPTGTNGCKGDPFTLTATIRPEPVGADDQVVTCSDNALTYDLQKTNINLKGNGLASTFAWTTAVNPNVTGFSSGTQTSGIITDNIKNESGTEQTVIYSVTPTGSNGCRGRQFSVSAAIQPAPVIVMKWGDILICSNKQNLYTAYQWLKNDNPVSGAFGQYYSTAKKTGIYKVQTIDKNGCSSMSNEIIISGSKSLSVYPNPASSSIRVSLNDKPLGSARITIVNAAGMKIREFHVEKTTTDWHNEIPVDDLDEGAYYVIVAIDTMNIYYSKILIIR